VTHPFVHVLCAAHLSQVDELSLQRAMAEKARKESSGRNIWTGKAVRGPQGDGGPPGRRARELSMYRSVVGGRTQSLATDWLSMRRSVAVGHTQVWAADWLSRE